MFEVGRRFWIGYVLFWLVLGGVSLARGGWWLVLAALCGLATSGINLRRLRRTAPSD